MTDTYKAVCSMLNAFETFLTVREYGEKPFLFPDEIADILRSAPNGSAVEIWDFPDVREVYTIHRNTRGTEYVSEYGHSLRSADMIDLIYNEIETEGYITIDGNDILRM